VGAAVNLPMHFHQCFGGVRQALGEMSPWDPLRWYLRSHFPMYSKCGRPRVAWKGRRVGFPPDGPGTLDR